MTAAEKDHKRKARKISFYVHGVIVLLLIFWVLPYNEKNTIDTQFAVQVAFDNSKSSNSTLAKAAMGKKRNAIQKIETIERKPTEKVEVNTKQPELPEIKTPEPSAPSEPVVTDMIEEESEIVAIESDIEIQEPEPDIVEEPMPIDIPASTPGSGTNTSGENLDDILADIEEPVENTEMGIPTEIEESTPEEGTTSPGGIPSTEEGTGTGEAGDGTGDGESGTDADDGVGENAAGDGVYDDSGDGIFGRRVVYRNIKQMLQTASSKSGKIVMKVCIDRSGVVTYVELNELLTTIKDRKMIRNAMSAMWDYKYEPDNSAPREECGKFSVSVDNFNGIRPIN